MPIKKIYLLYHCEYINLPYIPALNELSEKKTFFGWEVPFQGYFCYTLCTLQPNVPCILFICLTLNVPCILFICLTLNTLCTHVIYTSCNASYKDAM